MPLRSCPVAWCYKAPCILPDKPIRCRFTSTVSNVEFLNLWNAVITEKQRKTQYTHVFICDLHLATWYYATMKIKTVFSLKCMVICFLNNKMQKFLSEWKTFTPWNIIHLCSYIASMRLYTWHVKYEAHHCICLNDAVFCIAV